MTTPGAENGTNVLVAIEDDLTPGTFLPIGGQNSHTITINNNPIDITNKSSASFRELLADEGLQSLDLSLELTYTSEAAYQQMRGNVTLKAQSLYQIMIGATIISGTFMIGTFGETSPDNDKLTNSVSLLSTGAFVFA